MRIIIGSGKVCENIIKDNDIVISHSEIDVTNIKSVYKALDDKCVDKNTVVINTAAKINLEWCELNKKESYDVNTIGAVNVLKVCSDIGAKMVHISSGCIFDGNDQIMTESSYPTPAAWYTRTKVWADEFILNYGYDNFLILRPRQLVSSKPNSTNMITKFLELAKTKELNLIDEPNSITSLSDFSLMIDHLISTDQKGIFNCVNSGQISPYEIGLLLQNKFPFIKLNKISYFKFLETLKVKRVNTLLSSEKIIASGFNPRSAEEAMIDVINNYKERK